MRRHRLTRARLSLLTAVTMLVTGAVWVAIPDADAAARAPVPETARARWLTLVTGDRVRIGGTGDDVDAVEGGPGRAGATFLREREGGDTFVVPADVAPMIAAGRVDRRLFNVSGLVRAGYDRGDLPVIVGHGAAAGPVRATVADAGGKVTRPLPSISASAVRVPSGGLAEFWKTVGAGKNRAGLAGGATRLWLDGKVKASLDRSVAQIGAPAAWRAGHTGRGASVAVLDTGIDTGHPDFAGAVTAARDFTGSASGVDDRFGHGTHVAGIITGDGAAANGKYAGVAPDATLLNGKVLDDNGDGSESSIIAGMQWAVDQHADVVNMSLGSSEPDDGTNPLSAAVNELTRASGTLFVVAAGNLGPARGSVSAPGSATEALTVGAVGRQEEVADFSGRGPRLGDLAVKPDITAPGVGIVSALAEDSFFAETRPAVDGRYVSLNGTSMATPHVAGAAALLAGQHPDWPADRLKAALTGTAAPAAGATVYEQGAGRVDVARAVTQRVTADRVGLDLGTALWPHPDDKPVDSAVTYRNDGDAPVTLDLAADVRDQQGNPAPAGMFTLRESRIVVPAGGTAVAHLVTDTRVAAPDGTYGGVLVASGGPVAVRTPIGVTREPESYDVALTVTDRTGHPTPEYRLRFVGIDNKQVVRPYDASGKFVARLPKGDYYIDAEVLTPRPESPWWGYDVAVMAEPKVSITAATAMTFDGRDAKPFGFAVPRAGARNGHGFVQVRRTTSGSPTGMDYLGPWDGLFLRPSRTAAPADQFSVMFEGRYARDDGKGGFTGSPYLYNLRRTVTGKVPAQLTPRVADRDLAAVRTRVAASAAGDVALVETMAPVPTPGRITEYFTPGVSWEQMLSLRAAGAEVEHTQLVRKETFRRGPNGTRRWNAGVFGPSLRTDATTEYANFVLSRSGDVIDLFVPELFTDPGSGDSWSRTTGAQATLWRDGRQVGETEDPENFRRTVEPGKATYRLAVGATRTVSDFSTRVDVAWTFTSDTTPVEPVTALPITVLRLAPQLDDHNRAPAGRPLRIPLRLERHDAAGYGTVTAVTVQASLDDGKTWRPARVSGAGLNRTVLVDHPAAGGGFVSLRASATDSAGNTVEQTVIRAYRIAG